MKGYGSASYGDGFADVYDAWYPSGPQTEEAVEALAMLAGAGPVLELGCGTGRLCVPLADRGLPVVGLDASSAMLERLTEKLGQRRQRRADPGSDQAGAGAHPPGPEAHRADMARFELGAARFSLVFAAFNTLFNLGRAEDQAACFATVARHLQPGGCFAVECFVPPDGSADTLDPPWGGPDGGSPTSGGPGGGSRGEGGGGQGQADGAPVDAIELRELDADRVVLRISRQDPGRQTISGQHVTLSADGVRLRPWHLRYATLAELDGMALAAGLVLERRWADWSGAPFDDGADQHVSLYRRAGGAPPPGAGDAGHGLR